MFTVTNLKTIHFLFKGNCILNNNEGLGLFLYSKHFLLLVPAFFCKACNKLLAAVTYII